MLRTKKENVFSLVIIFIFLSCSGIEKQKDKPLKKVSINMVTHGQATDPFWSVVSNGAKDAAKELGIDFYYQSPQNFDMITMSQIIDAVVSTNPDGIIVSVPDVAALKKSILAASKKNIPIIVINAGS
ncbi:substrate-binding domain-containing protein, partial [Candidatus Marinimicrobia bacterium]|nr:substrate-binding domain-containing protein [Candidatus Neomarinimicrobiota bacterium]